MHLIDDADSNSEIEDKWCCFEEDLAKLRWELILDSVEYEYDDENDFEPWKTENKLSIKAQTCGDSNHILRTYFREWITYINELINEMGDDSKKPFFEKVFGDSDKYLTFNYTNTLEQPKVTSLDIESEGVKNLYKYIMKINTNQEELVYRSTKVTEKDLNNQLKLMTIFENVDESDASEIKMLTDENGYEVEHTYYTKETIEEVAKKVFGDDVTITHESCESIFACA